MKRRRISRQLVVSIVLIVVVVLGCSTAAYRALLNRNFERMIGEEIAAGREAVRLKVTERTRRAQLIAHFIATDPAVRDTLTDETGGLLEQLNRYRPTDLDADLLTITNADGVILAQVEPEDPLSGARPSRIGESLALNPLFMPASDGRPVAGLEVCLPDVICIDAFEPVRGAGTGGRTLGFVRVGFIIGDAFAREVRIATGTDFFLLRRNIGLASSLPPEKFTPEEARRLADAIRPAGDEPVESGGSRSRLALGDTPYVLESTAVPDAAGRAIGRQVIGRDTSDVARAEREASLLLAAVAALGLALALALSLFSARRISRPLGELLERVREITAGRLDAHIPLKRDDEIGELADAFNDMSRSLRERDHRLREGADELRRRQDQLIQSGKLAAIGELAAGIAHEIGNPLSALSGYAQMIQERQHSAEEQAEFAAEIEREAEFIERIIHDLLEFSRPSENVLKKVDLRELAESAIKTASAHKAFGKLKIERRFAPDIPDIPCYPEEIQQVFLNLIMNAAQAMPDGGTISVEGELRPDCALFRVRDQGPGVPPEIRDNIFNPFYTTKPPGVGTGLGLAITYRIIEKHGGRIELEGTAEGASFAFTLPFDTQN